MPDMTVDRLTPVLLRLGEQVNKKRALFLSVALCHQAERMLGQLHGIQGIKVLAA